MKHVYKLVGATCESCKSKVEKALSSLMDVLGVEVSRDLKSVKIEMSKHIEISELNNALVSELGDKYSLEVVGGVESLPVKSVKTYFPLILVVSYIIMGTLMTMFLIGDWSLMFGMRMFMGLFFLGFAFFKLLDIPGFAMSYMSYDVVAVKWMKWGYVYPFIELCLGIWFVSGWRMLEASILTAVIMGVSLVGVIKSVVNGRDIKCACLGTGFNLPMSRVTIVEDGGMIVMALWMIWELI